jgi:hypothetical protein
LGVSEGYERSKLNCTDGLLMSLIAGLMICITLSMILRSCWWRGIGCGVTRVRARLGWTGSRRLPVRAGPLGRRGRSTPKLGKVVQKVSLAIKTLMTDRTDHRAGLPVRAQSCCGIPVGSAADRLQTCPSLSQDTLRPWRDDRRGSSCGRESRSGEHHSTKALLSMTEVVYRIMMRGSCRRDHFGREPHRLFQLAPSPVSGDPSSVPGTRSFAGSDVGGRAILDVRCRPGGEFGHF